MSSIEKLVKRLKSKTKDFTYNELKTILNNFGFIEYNKGRTSGSRVKFYNKDNVKIELHKPHNSKVLKLYQIIDLIKFLEERGEI